MFEIMVQGGVFPATYTNSAKMALGWPTGRNCFFQRARVAPRDAQKYFCFCQERFWLGSACLEMEETISVLFSFKAGCSPRYTQICQNGTGMANRPELIFFNTCVRRGAPKNFSKICKDPLDVLCQLQRTQRIQQHLQRSNYGYNGGA